MLCTITRSTRARRMRLEVRADGQVVLIAPERASIASIEAFYKKHTKWVERAAARMRGREVVRIKRGDIPALKRQAQVFAKEKVEHVARLYGVGYKRISIRAQKTRWGSCSRNGNISFNYKIAALPRDIAEYIIVHEVCHLLVFNHSHAFWAQVARTVPDHHAVRTRLRRMVFVFE